MTGPQGVLKAHLQPLPSTTPVSTVLPTSPLLLLSRPLRTLFLFPELSFPILPFRSPLQPLLRRAFIFSLVSSHQLIRHMFLEFLLCQTRCYEVALLQWPGLQRACISRLQSLCTAVLPGCHPLCVHICGRLPTDHWLPPCRARNYSLSIPCAKPSVWPSMPSKSL